MYTGVSRHSTNHKVMFLYCWYVMAHYYGSYCSRSRCARSSFHVSQQRITPILSRPFTEHLLRQRLFVRRIDAKLSFCPHNWCKRSRKKCNIIVSKLFLCKMPVPCTNRYSCFDYQPSTAYITLRNAYTCISIDNQQIKHAECGVQANSAIFSYNVSYPRKSVVFYTNYPRKSVVIHAFYPRKSVVFYTNYPRKSVTLRRKYL